MPGSYLEFLFSSPVIFTLPSISVFLWAKIDNTALNAVFWCILHKMSFRYQKFKECLISKPLGYEVKLQIVTHIFFFFYVKAYLGINSMKLKQMA